MEQSLDLTRVYEIEDSHYPQHQHQIKDVERVFVSQ